MGRPSLRPSPRPRLILTSCTDMDSDTTDTDSDTMADTMADSDTTARGLLMLRLIPTSCTDVVLVTLDTTDMDSDTTDSDTDTAESSTANRLHQDLSVNHRLDLRQKWIVISLKFPSPVLQFQCYHTLVMVSRKQENERGKKPTNIKITKK